MMLGLVQAEVRGVPTTMGPAVLVVVEGEVQTLTWERGVLSLVGAGVRWRPGARVRTVTEVPDLDARISMTAATMSAVAAESKRGVFDLMAAALSPMEPSVMVVLKLSAAA